MSEETIQVLIGARARVAKGWCQGRSFDEAGRVCAGHALNLALRKATQKSSVPRSGVLISEVQDCFVAAMEELFLDDKGICVPIWNDQPQRTQQEVLDTFDRAIKIAGKEG